MSLHTTARFDLERRRQLKSLFSRQKLANLWRHLVKTQMRRFDITDLHDYYDFNFAIEARADAIVDRVLAGQYRAERPLIYRLEKKLGICRHLLIPAPSDALVFQLLTDALFDAVKKAQPSKKAFYSRARHNVALPHEHMGAESFPWFILWPKFQKEIWKFTKTQPFLVTTDLTNYFDNIGLRELRHVISAIAKTKEVYLDLLFSLIEDLSWNPDYLPTSHKGLPIIDIEAPRLLAHALLFEVDYVLKTRTRDHFVRWMDDINFAVPDLRHAKIILGEVNDVLKSRGLALNLGKTAVMTAADAQHHFMFRENIQLTKIDAVAKKVKAVTAKERLAGKLEKKLAGHVAKCKAKNKDKVTKRYFTILGRLGVPVGLQQAVDVYLEHPGLRKNVLAYLCRLPFCDTVADTFLQILKQTEHYDDASRFAYVSALVDWDVPRDGEGKAFVGRVRKRLESAETAFDWLCSLVFLAKYGQGNEVLNKALAGKKYKEPFFARQRAAASARGLDVNANTVLLEWRREISTGYSDSASVAANLLAFAKAAFPTKSDRLYYYLFPEKAQKPYPLPKFLLLCVVAYGEKRAEKTARRPVVANHVSDPWYRHWLGKIHPHWF